MTARRALAPVSALAVGLVMWLGACERPARNPSAGAKQGPAALPDAPRRDPRCELSIPSALAPDERYVFAVDARGAAAGEAARCSLAVRVMRGQTVLSTLQLDPCWSAEVAAVPAATVAGVGDPLGEPERWTSFRLGQGDDAQAVAAKLARLGAKREAVVLHQVHRGAVRDSVLLRQGSELRRVDLEGRWSALDVRPGGPDSDRLVLFAQVPGEPGFVWAAEPTYDAAAGTFTLDPQRDPGAYLALLGPYPSVEQATDVAASHCLKGAVVAPSDAYQDVAPGKYIVAALSADAKLAQAAVAAPCAEKYQRAVLALRYRDVVIGRHEVGGATVELGLGRYGGAGWPLTATLRESGRVRDRLELGWPATTPAVRPAADVDLPAGDPLRPARGALGVALGEPPAQELAAVQAVTLAAGRAALLVSTQAGFEHLHRRHDLLMVRDGRLQLAWSAVDPQGPAWSTVVVRRRGAGAEEVLYMSAFYSSEEAQVDRLEIQRVAWDARAGAVAVTPVGCRDGVFLIVSQAFATLEKALAAKSSYACSSPAATAPTSSVGPLVLPAPTRSGRKGFVLAHVSAERRAAEQMAARAARCWPDAHPAVIAWCPPVQAGD